MQEIILDQIMKLNKVVDFFLEMIYEWFISYKLAENY